ncbi:MAG: hypothetical protein QW838_02810 [Candidatus Nitrosotenuis sp.]
MGLYLERCQQQAVPPPPPPPGTPQPPKGCLSGGSLVCWLDAQALSLNDGAVVSTWDDQSGKGNHATIHVGDPTFRTGVINGRPGVEFRGESNVRKAMKISGADVSSFDLADSVGYSIGMVVRVQTASPFTHGRFFQQRNPSTSTLAEHHTLSSVSFRFSVADYDGPTVVNTYASAILDVPLRLIWRLKVPDLFIMLNGTEYGFSGGLVNVQSPATTTACILGGVYNTLESATQFFSGYIGEFLLYRCFLSDAERDQLDTYFKEKWGLV